MNKLFFCSAFLALSSFISSSYAGIVITGTRVIYPSDKEFVSVPLTNVGDKVVLVQSWVDLKEAVADPNSTKAPFVVTPPITTVEANKGQALRIIFNHKDKLASDRETLFWLNVLDIPSKPDIEDANYLQFAIRSRLKLFYRPTNIRMEQQQAFEQVEVQRVNNQLEINNPTPYYLNFSKFSLVANNQTTTDIKDITYIEPFSKQNVNVENLANTKSIRFYFINDFGSVLNIEKNL